MAINNGRPHLQIEHNLSGLYLADCKWLHLIVIAFTTLCPVQFYIQWCMALHQTHRSSYCEKLFFPCLGSQFSQKATTVGRPPNSSNLIYQSWGITEPYHFITLSLDSYWTYFSKHYIYMYQNTKFGSQNFVYQIWFCIRLLIQSWPQCMLPHGIIRPSEGDYLTLKRLGHFFQYVILFPNVIQQKSNILIWNWSNKLNV